MLIHTGSNGCIPWNLLIDLRLILQRKRNTFNCKIKNHIKLWRLRKEYLAVSVFSARYKISLWRRQT